MPGCNCKARQPRPTERSNSHERSAADECNFPLALGAGTDKIVFVGASHCFRQSPVCDLRGFSWLVVSWWALAFGFADNYATPLSDGFTIHHGGQGREFIVAKDELWVEHGQSKIFRFPPVGTSEEARKSAVNLRMDSAKSVSLVLYECGVPRNEFTRRILTKHVLLKLAKGTDAPQAGVARISEFRLKAPSARHYALTAAVYCQTPAP